jgi:hypothetical protein
MLFVLAEYISADLLGIDAAVSGAAVFAIAEAFIVPQ